jgi:hypothetical protein
LLAMVLSMLLLSPDGPEAMRPLALGREAFAHAVPPNSRDQARGRMVTLIVADNGAAGTPYLWNTFRSQLAGGFRRSPIEGGLSLCPPFPAVIPAATRPGQRLSLAGQMIVLTGQVSDSISCSWILDKVAHSFT